MTDQNALQPVANMLLAHNELLLIAKLLKAETLPGLDLEPSPYQTKEQEGLALVYAEQSLRARQLARLTEAGDLQLQGAVMTAVGTCAYPERSLHIYRIQPNGVAEPCFAHRRGETIVAHTLAEPAVHRLSILPGQPALDFLLQAFCQWPDLPPVQADPCTVPSDVVQTVKEQAKAGDLGTARANLIEHGASPATAEQLVAALAQPYETVALYRIEYQQTGAVIQRLSVLRAADALWLMLGPDEQAPGQPYIFRPTIRPELEEIIQLG